MKKILAFVVAIVLCLSCFAACGKKTETPAGTGSTPTQVVYNVEDAAAYLKNMYKKYLIETETAADFTLVSQVMKGGVVYTVEWTVDNEGIKVLADEANKQVKIDLDEKTKVDVNYKLTATVKDPDGKTATLTFELKVPKYVLSSWKDYMAAQAGKALIIEGYVVAVHSQQEGNKYNQLYLQDVNGDGGYYIYSIADSVDPAKDLGIKPGMLVSVTGTKDIYSGTHELKDAVVNVLDTNTVNLKPIDITAAYKNAKSLTDENLVSKFGMLVTIKGVEITDQDLVENHMYMNFKLGNLTSYVRVYATDCPASVSDKGQQKIISDHAAKKTYSADVTGVVVMYSGAIYLNPVSDTPFTYGKLIQRTDAEKIEVEKENLTVEENIANKMTITVPVKGTSYGEVTIAWASDNDCAVVNGNKITFTPAETAQTVTLTATFTCGSATATKTFTVTVDAAATDLYAPIFTNTVAEGKAYKFAIKQATLGKTIYVTGEVSGRYLATTEKITDAADVYVEAVTGGYKFYILDGETKKYITVYNNAENKLSVKYDAAGTSVYSYVAETNCWKTTFDGTEYYLGTYSNFNTVSASKTSYITAANTGVSQFPAEFATVADAAYATENVTKPAASTAYKFSLYQTTLGKTLYVTGEVSGRYLATTDKIDDAADVYVEAVTGGYKFYILDGETKKYITVYNNAENKLSVKYDAAGTSVYSYVAETNCWKTTFDGAEYYLGTYSNFNTVSASKTSYITAANTGVSQFPANIVSLTLKPIAPVSKSQPAANTAYKFSLYQTTLGKTLYVTGEVSGRYLATTDKLSKAADVYAEAVTGGYKFYILDGETKKYITIYNNAENKLSVKYDAAGTSVYSYVAETNCWKTTFDGAEYYLGTYSNFNTVSASKTSYITAANTGVSQFPANICAMEFYKPGTDADDDNDDADDNNSGSSTTTPSTATSFNPNTFTANSSYGTYTSTDGWSTSNCAIVNTDVNESYALPGTAVVLRGRKDQQGVLTSCLYANGIKSLTFKYGYGYTETKGFELAIRIKNSAGTVVAQTTLTKDNLSKGTTNDYTWTLGTAVSGNFTIEFANLGTDSGNKHRLSIWDISWVNNK